MIWHLYNGSKATKCNDTWKYPARQDKNVYPQERRPKTIARSNQRNIRAIKTSPSHPSILKNVILISNSSYVRVIKGSSRPSYPKVERLVLGKWIFKVTKWVRGDHGLASRCWNFNIQGSVVSHSWVPMMEVNYNHWFLLSTSIQALNCLLPHHHYKKHKYI